MPIEMSCKELCLAVEGKLLTKGTQSFKGIGTDTRQDLSGKLFVPFKGENFDAHDFLEKAMNQGAKVLLTHKKIKFELNPDVEVVLVEDTLVAFQKLANFWRKKVKATIVGITGSNGKTTTKEFAASILKSAGIETSWSQKSFNNHWGVPISLLSIQPHHKVALVEMGMNHPGELKELCEIAEPDVAVVTFVGASHLEGLGSVEGVARAKEEIYQHSPNEALRIYNLDNEHTAAMFERAQKNSSQGSKMTFSHKDKKADVFLKLKKESLKSLVIEGTIQGHHAEVEVDIFGGHNVTNLAAAACIALSAKVSPEQIWIGLANCRSAWGRGQWLSHPQKKFQILFDAYNANPESMKVLLQSFARERSVAESGRRYAILGEMKELGDQTEEEHRQLARQVAHSSLAGVWFVGESASVFAEEFGATKSSKKLLISNAYEQSLALEMASVLEPSDIVAIKGSRGVGLEKVLKDWNVSF